MMREKKNINNDITFEDAIKVADIENVILKRRNNNILLSDYQEEVLRSRGINSWCFFSFCYFIYCSKSFIMW